MNNFKLIAFSFLLISLLGLILFVILKLSNTNTNSDQKEIQFRGKILKLQYFDGNRGLPIIYLSDTSFLMSMKEEKILHYIKVGDSIVRNLNSPTIYIYRKDSLDLWRVVVFK